MTLAQGRLGRAWMSLISSLSGCHFDEESAKGASGLNWACIGWFYTLDIWIFVLYICIYVIRMHLYMTSHRQSFGVLRHLGLALVWKWMLLLQATLAADGSGESTSTEISLCINQWSCELLRKIVSWRLVLLRWEYYLSCCAAAFEKRRSKGREGDCNCREYQPHCTEAMRMMVPVDV